MNLSELHTHFDWNNVKLFSLSEDYRHCIYFKEGTNKKVTIPKLDGKDEYLKTELIIGVCKYLEIEIPVQVA